MATSTAPAPIASASGETAETQAAAAALVVDSVVEGVVTNATTATATESTTPPEQQQQQDPSSSAKPQTPSATTVAAAEAPKATVQTYNNIQNSKRKERLEQNRISARESRKRKKSMIEELQRTVIALTAENKELNGRNRSLRTNLSDIGRKYPTSASIQAILSGVPTPTPQQQPQTPVPAATVRGAPVMAAGNFLQQLPAQPSVGVVPIMAATAAPAMVVPYMYIPQAGHAPAGLVQIAAQRQPVMVQAAAQAAQPAATVPEPQQQPTQQPQVAIAPQTTAAAPPMAQQHVVATAPILPAPVAIPAAPAPVPVAAAQPVAAMPTIPAVMEPVPNPMVAADTAVEFIQVPQQEGQTAAPM